MFELRAWQKECARKAVEKFRGENPDFLLVATPGGGKTFMALYIAKQLLEEGRVDRIVVVVPTSYLKEQWAKDAAKIGLKLDYKGDGTIRGFHGSVVTYQAACTSPGVYQLQSARYRTVAIFDELHHCGKKENLKWGPALREGFNPCLYRIAASGTPFRTDKSQIPFIQYAGGRPVADYQYGYKQAVRDGVCRMAFFHTWDGELRWHRNGETFTHTFSESIDEELVSDRLKTALQADGDWMRQIIRAADSRLSECRALGHPDAGGLVVAMDQEHARKIASLIEILTKSTPVLAVSDEPDASGNISSFVKSNQRWIVAVRMVSEGVNIPRLRVLVYATNIASELFFRQFVGRGIRFQEGLDEQCLHVFIPSWEMLMSYAKAMDEEREQAIDEEIEEYEKTERNGGQRTLNLSDYAAISSTGLPSGGIAEGNHFSEYELAQAAQMAQQIGIRAEPWQVAALLRAARGKTTSGSERTENSQSDEPTLRELMTRERKEHKALVAIIRRLANARGEVLEYRDVHSRWLKENGTPAKDSDLDELQQKTAWLEAWIQRLRG